MFNLIFIGGLSLFLVPAVGILAVVIALLVAGALVKGWALLLPLLLIYAVLLKRLSAKSHH
jgi:hypothetical protein